jgi:hypothetical protein
MRAYEFIKPIEVKFADDSRGTIECYVSTFGNKDHGGYRRAWCVKL